MTTPSSSGPKSEPEQNDNENFDAFIKSMKYFQRLKQTIDELMPIMEDAEKYLESWGEGFKKKSEAEDKIFKAVQDLGLVRGDAPNQHSVDILVSNTYAEIEKYLKLLRPLLDKTISQALKQEVAEDMITRLLLEEVAGYFNHIKKEN